MSFFKKGTPVKIGEIAKTEMDFDSLRKQIAEENQLVRCPGCQHLLAKKSTDGIVDVQHKRESLLITRAEKVQIQCPICRNVTNA